MAPPVGKILARRKELMLFVCALVIAALVAASSVSGWLSEETWGDPITVRRVETSDAVPTVTLPDFAAIWEDGGRNPFGDAAVALESGGKAHIPLPPAPPLWPELPPPPLVRPADFLTEGGR